MKLNLSRYFCYICDYKLNCKFLRWYCINHLRFIISVVALPLVLPQNNNIFCGITRDLQ